MLVASMLATSGCTGTSGPMVTVTDETGATIRVGDVTLAPASAFPDGTSVSVEAGTLPDGIPLADAVPAGTALTITASAGPTGLVELTLPYDDGADADGLVVAVHGDGGWRLRVGRGAGPGRVAVSVTELSTFQPLASPTVAALRDKAQRLWDTIVACVTGEPCHIPFLSPSDAGCRPPAPDTLWLIANGPGRVTACAEKSGGTDVHVRLTNNRNHGMLATAADTDLLEPIDSSLVGPADALARAIADLAGVVYLPSLGTVTVAVDPARLDGTMTVRASPWLLATLVDVTLLTVDVLGIELPDVGVAVLAECLVAAAARVDDEATIWEQLSTTTECLREVLEELSEHLVDEGLKNRLRVWSAFLWGFTVGRAGTDLTIDVLAGADRPDIFELTPTPPKPEGVDIGALVDEGMIVDDVHYVEVNGRGPEEIVVVGHRKWEPSDTNALEVGAVLVFGWHNGEWVEWFNAEEGAQPLLGDPTGNSEFEAFLDLAALELVDFDEDGTTELAIASKWVTAASGGPLAFGVIDFEPDGSPVDAFRHEPDPTTGRGGSLRADGRTVVLELPHRPPPVGGCCRIGTEYVTIGWDGNSITQLDHSVERIELRGDGLGVASFGTPQADAMEVISGLLNEPRDLEEYFGCMWISWLSPNSGLTLGFADGRLVAWGTTSNWFSTPSGVRVGTDVGDLYGREGYEVAGFIGEYQEFTVTSGPDAGVRGDIVDVVTSITSATGCDDAP